MTQTPFEPSQLPDDDERIADDLLRAEQDDWLNLALRDGHNDIIDAGLTDFVDRQTLQEIQDTFTAVSHLPTTICDRQGKPVTVPTNRQHLDESNRLLADLLEGDEQQYGPFAAPIVIGGQSLGQIVVHPELSADDESQAMSQQRIAELGDRLGLSAEQVEKLQHTASVAAERTADKPAAVQFLFLLASAVSRFCAQAYLLRTRVKELSALYQLSKLLAGHRDVQDVLTAAAKSVTEVMEVRAALIGMVDEEGGEIVSHAWHNMSRSYATKGPLLIPQSQPTRQMLAGEVVHVRDMASDARIIYRAEAADEGFVSMIGTGMIYQGRPIGTIRLFTDHQRDFNAYEVRLLRAVARLLATAIETTRLNELRHESAQLQQQLKLASDVQQRMLPSKMPTLERFDVAARYVPCFDLGGDFYDFIQNGPLTGICVGDVVGKGIAASLLMASTRATIRAYAQQSDNPAWIIEQADIAMQRETLDAEFATVFYGVLDPDALTLRYCSAGHDPAYLMRNGDVESLTAGGPIIGVDLDTGYTCETVQLQPGDMIVIYTDGLPDSQSFDGRRFGRDRIIRAMREIDGADNAHQIVQHLLWEMRRFTGVNRSVDDCSIVAITVR